MWIKRVNQDDAIASQTDTLFTRLGHLVGLTLDDY